MRKVKLPGSELEVTPISFGCMRFWDFPGEKGSAEHRAWSLERVHAALEGGINFFDHADIYGRHLCETLFSGLWATGVAREDLVVQSKCGIVPGKGYDFSRDYLLQSVDGILQRLETGYLDILLLHRPDLLMDPAEVAEAFNQMEDAGKVRHFGVSNFTPIQMDLLQSALRQPLIANQVQLSLLQHESFDSWLVPETATQRRDILEYCMLKGVSVQSWSPLDGGWLCGRDLSGDDAPEAAKAAAPIVAELAEQHGVAPEAIVLAWLLRHPAGIIPIIGTMNPDRIRACCRAVEVEMSREEWYRLYVAVRGRSVP